MLFNSLAFAIFLPIVFGLYWALPHRLRWAVLLLSSCYFYMSWNAKYIILILFTTIVSYISAILMERFSLKRKVLLLLTLSVSLGILFIFKYFNFVSESFSQICRLLSIPIHSVTLKLILPVGISFYTFQALSYVIDVYKGKVKAEHHFGKYAAFITFFPQLVAGPIERTENLLHQINEKHFFDYEQAAYGMKLMAWGFFKKLVIADNLAVFVDLIYGNVSSYQGFSLILATVFFSIQIYCDFSGYSDIAIGTARLFGIELMTNFRSPYFSGTVKEFWSRWHISLSTWFRDYIYIPLGGNRKGRIRQYTNLMITFFASGAWHGANWTFLMWGGVNGGLQVGENLLNIRSNRDTRRSLKWFLSVILVFAISCNCWIFFRAENIQDAVYVFSHMFDGMGIIKNYILRGYLDLQLNGDQVIQISCSLLALLVFDYASLKEDVLLKLTKLPTMCRWIIYYILVFWIIIFGKFGSSQFVYFQF